MLGFMRNIMLNMDPPRHRQHRLLVNKAFRPRLVEDLRPRIVAMVEGSDGMPQGASTGAESPMKKVPEQESGIPGDAPAPDAAEYRVLRTAPDGLGPASAAVDGPARRSARCHRGDCIPRSSFNLLSFPRFS